MGRKKWSYILGIFLILFGIVLIVCPAEVFETIVLVAGIVFGLLPLKLPSVLETVLSKLSSCMSPLAMILLGLTIGAAPVLKLFSGWT